MEKLSTKTPDEIWRVELNCSNWVPRGSSITDVSGEVLTGTIVLSDTRVESNTVVSCLLTGGTKGTSTFRVLVSMADGQKFSEDFNVFVSD